MPKTKDLKEKKTIFVIEDEPDILKLITVNLEKSGFAATGFLEAGPMLATLKKRLPDAIILDLMLPDYDGLEVCKTLKKNESYSQIPVVMVTAKTEEVDVVLGLELGADDYISKPFSPKELVARIKAVLRRSQRIPSPSSASLTPLEISGLMTIDPAKHEVVVKGQKVQLTLTEFLILRLLAEKPGWVFSRKQILDALWKDEKDVFDRTVDVHIKNLRDKLGPAGKFVKNIRGVGYKLEIE
jgi:DNA-binding response OmpR family regulator